MIERVHMVEITDEAERTTILASDSPDVPYPYEHEGRLYVMSDQLDALKRCSAQIKDGEPNV
jgi:hypothetical protein